MPKNTQFNKLLKKLFKEDQQDRRKIKDTKQFMTWLVKE